MTQVERAHRAAGHPVERRDYYEFRRPRGRGLTEKAIEIIARDIDVPVRDAFNDYIARGGRVRRSRGGA